MSDVSKILPAAFVYFSRWLMNGYLIVNICRRHNNQNGNQSHNNEVHICFVWPVYLMVR